MLLHSLPYHAGRISSYIAASALCGGFGAALLKASGWASLQSVLFALGNAFLILIGASFALRGSGLRFVERYGARVFALIAPLARRFAGAQGTAERYALGMIWGLVPCGMVYAVLALALLSGNALAAAGLGLAFGIGTLPNLLAAGWVLQRLRRGSSWAWVRSVAGVTLVAFGVLGMLRFEGLGVQLFCTVAH
jgi:hypothetical protein